MEQDLPLFARGPEGGIISPYLTAKGEEFNEWQKEKSRNIKAAEREMANNLYNWAHETVPQNLTNLGRKISEAKLPYIGDGRQYNMPTYDWDYNLVKWNPIFGPAAWTSAYIGEVAPILFADNAIDTIANGLPNVYNWAVDEYNAGASKRALNNYINNEGKEAREKIQRRQNQAMSAPAARRILQAIPNNATAEQTQQVVAQNNETLGRMEEAKKLVTNELKRMNAAGELTKDISRTKKLIDLYKKLK